MKKFAIVLLVLSLARVGVAYADTNTASNKAVTGSSGRLLSANQELVYVKGADGKDGQNGKDGQTGANGANGANGQNVVVTSFTGAKGTCTNGGLEAVSAQGTSYVCNGASGKSVIAIPFTGEKNQCKNGGIEFTDNNLTKSYVCNGADGANGANGANGLNGTNGTGSGSGGAGGFTYAQGSVLVGACDKFVVIKPLRSFTRMGFAFTGFDIGDNTITVTDTSTAPSTTLDGGLSSTCLGYKVTIEFFTDSAYQNAPYSSNDHIVCVSKQTMTNYSANSSNTRTISGGTYGSATSGEFECTADSSNATPSLRPKFALAYVNTADYSDQIGFQIG
ncbi:MAG: hypothetical protein RL130_1231 [Actinomycetota bacterium]